MLPSDVIISIPILERYLHAHGRDSLSMTSCHTMHNGASPSGEGLNLANIYLIKDYDVKLQ